MAFSALRSLFTDSPGNLSVMGALGDPQFRQEVAGNARDASIMGAAGDSKLIDEMARRGIVLPKLGDFIPGFEQRVEARQSALRALRNP